MSTENYISTLPENLTIPEYLVLISSINTASRGIKEGLRTLNKYSETALCETLEKTVNELSSCRKSYKIKVDELKKEIGTIYFITARTKSDEQRLGQYSNLELAKQHYNLYIEKKKSKVKIAIEIDMTNDIDYAKLNVYHALPAEFEDYERYLDRPY